MARNNTYQPCYRHILKCIHFLLKCKSIMFFIQSCRTLTLNVCLINTLGQLIQYIERLNNTLRYLVPGELSLDINPKRGLLL